jgi:hypothetical protein
MAALILGGAPGGNWTPLLLILIAFVVFVAGVDYTIRFIKRKLKHRRLPNTDDEIINTVIDPDTQSP